MTSTNDGNEVNSNQRSGHRNKSYYIELYKSLEARLNGEGSLEARTTHVCEAWRRVYSLYQHSAPSTHPHLFSWLQRHTASTVLQSKWAESKSDHARLTAALESLVAEVEAAAAGRDHHPWEQLLLQRANWFRKALENPWGHPVLKSLINPNGEPVTDQQVLEWLVEERGIVLVTRLRQLVSAGNCDDLALLLAAAVMDRARAATPRRPDDANEDKTEQPVDSTSFVAVLERDANFTADVWELLTDIELVLLLKTDKRPRCIELAKLTPLRHGYAMVERLRNRLETSPRDKKLWKHAKEVATLVTQVIIARCMVLQKCAGVGRAALYCCARSLARLVPPARLPAVSNTLAAAAATARHLHTFCTALDAQCSADMKPFICELYVRAITAGMNELEQLKLNAEKPLEARSCEQMLASWFTQLGALLDASARLRAECALTAFSVHPAPNFYERVADMPQPPPLKTAQEPTPETTSEFGSWANDSRTQSNLVKTSETLQMKQTEQHQANVLSTAVLTEGETLGLEPELCQDLSVLLSGPRVKTLSWDMDREVLLQNCRSYMERTHGGTRAVTTELKYLNLDPSAYVHLPEEDDEETGIERGYEHELQLENPEEIWEEAFFDGEITDSAEDSEVEIQLSKLRKIQLAKTKKDKKSKAPAVSSDDEEDPLSCLVDAKKEKKKLAKEKSKEQRRKKTHKRDTSKDDGRDRRKVKDKKPKKERKKDKSEQPMTGSLTSLLGMKISNMPSPVQDGEKTVRKKKERRRNTDALFSYVAVTDSDYDSQEKSSQKSDDPNIVVDGVFSMDELKSPERQSDSQIDNMKPTLKTYGIAQSTVINDIKSRPKLYSPKVSTTSEDSDVSRSKSPYLTPNQQGNRHVVSSKVKSSISKLLQFRRNKAHHRPVPSKSPAPSNPPPAAPQTLVGMKIYNADEIPKVYTNKKQTPDVKNMSNLFSEKMVNNRPHVPYNETAKADNKLQNLYNVQKHSQDNSNTMLGMSPNVPNESPKVHVEYLHSSPTKVIQHSNFVINQSPSHAHRSYVSPVKSVDHMSPQALNLSPPKQKIVHQPFHRSLQNLSTDNMKYDTPKKPILINDPNYHQQAKSSTSPLSPRILSNTCIKAPNQTVTSSQSAKDNFTLSHSNLTSRGSVQNVSQITNLKSDVIRYGSKQLSSSMQDVNDITKKHIPSNNDMRRGTTNYTLPYSIKSQSDLSNTSQTYLVGENTSVSRCTPIQNHVKTHQNVLPTQHTTGSELKSNYQEFFDNLAKSINAGSYDPGKSIHLNKHVKVTPVQVPSTPAIEKRINSTQCAKQLIQQKKIETAPNTFSRRNYNKNKQNESKLLNNSLSLELNKNIIDHKLIKAKCMRNNVVISRVPIPNKQEQGNMVNDIDQSSTKFQKACPVLTSMLDSPKKCIEKGPTHTNSTTTGQNVSDNQIDREHADLLLLLRQQPVVKPHLNTIGTSTSDAILNQNLSSGQTLIGTKVKNIGTVLDNNPSVASAGVKQESTVKENMPQDWERVMDALLAHKTEPLGPNALDMVLKKDYKRHSQSSSRSQTSHKPRTSSQSSVQIKPDSKQRELSSKPSSATRKPSTEKEIPKRRRPSGGTIKKPSTTDVLKRTEDQSKYVSTNSSKDDDPFISGIPNSAYDMLGDLLDDDLRRELGELSSDEDAYNTPNMAMVKEKSSNIPKTGASECKMSKTTKEISHIVNPQKILRKVETKPKTVDSDSTTAYPNVKINDARQQDATTMEIPHIVNPQNILRNIETKPNTVNAGSTTSYPNVIVNNSSQQDAATMSELRPTVVCTSIEQQHAATVISNPIEPNMANHTIVGPHHFITNIDPTNVIIASVPVPAQPVVVIRQDLVYDPYPTIRIHESQVSAGLCNVNQNVYAINTTPNIAVYQTTQFAAPVVNPVIIGNAMTSTDAKDPVGDQQCAPDPMKDNEKPPNKSDIDSAIANRLMEDNNEMPDKSNNLDFNMNKNCERKVLSQVQENHLTENSEIESHKRNLSDDYALKTEQHAERIKLKRQSLLNRKINHACYHPPIPLTYTPLSEKINLGKILHKETPKNGTIAANLLSIPKSTDSVEKHVSIDSTSIDSPNPEINNENIESSKQASAQEKQKSCRRIWLRSSNKLDDKMSPVKRNRIPLRRNKFKLKVTKKGIQKITHVQNENEVKVKNAPRISRRLVDKNKLKSDTSVSSSNQQHNELVNNEKDKSLNPTQLQQNDLENLIDFEEELWGSKILKTSTATVGSEETSNHATHSNDVTDDEENYNTDDEQVANCDTVGDMQSNLDGIKETEVAHESNKPTYNDVKPDVVIGRLQNKLGDQLVIKSLTVNASELPGDSNITVKNHESKILADNVEEKHADITITKPKDCKDTTKCIKVTPDLEVQNKPQTSTINAESLKTNEKLSRKVMPKAATVMVQRKSNRRIKSISTEVASVLKPLDTKHTPMMQKDCPMRTLPETNTQPSDKVIVKTNSIGSATNKAPETRTTGNKSLLCNENINDLPKIDCASNTNAVIVNRDKRAPIICKPTNVFQQTTTKTPVLIDKSKNVNNAPAVPKANSNWARVDNNENRKIYIKGDIQIEELPTSDTDVKHVRISLPNGKIFKAAISGKIHGNFDSLFDQPTMKAILAGGLSDGKRYTVNYTQVLRANKGAPDKIIETQIQNMKIKDLSPVDTVNLVSDEEDEVEAVAETHIFTTEFGKYTTDVDQETFNQHQKKFTQKCEVKVVRHRLEVNAIKPNLKSSFSVKSSLLTRNQNKELPNFTITTNKILEVDSSVKDVDKDVTPVDIPTDMQETSSFNAMTPAESTLLTRESEQSANTSTIPADDPYNKDDFDLPPVYLDNTVKSTPAQETSVLSRSLSPVNNSILSQHQTNLDADTATTSKLLPQIDSHLKDDDTVLVNCTNEKTSTLSQKQTSSTSDVAKTTEVIEIDDSSNDSVVENITSNTDSNKNADAVSEALTKVLLENLSVKPAMETDKNIVIPPVIQSITAVTNLKTALLQDLGIVPSVAPVIDIDDSDEDEIQIPTVKQTSSIIKECVVKLLKCDNLVKKYELMRAMKRCYVKLERLNNSMLETATEASLNADINNKATEERKQDTDEDFIQFDVEETFGSPQLSRCPSLSILDNWDYENQPSPNSPYPSSPVMEVYDAIVQLRNKYNDESELVYEPENSYSLTCDSEWTLTKFGYRTQELLLSTLILTTENEESEILLTSCDCITINEEKKLLTTTKAPKLLTMAIQFLEENSDLIYQMESMRKTRKTLVNTPTNTLKRKTDTSFEDSVANKIFKLGTLALNALNSCFKTVGASRISYNYNKGDGTNVNERERKFAILEFTPNSIHDFEQINVIEDKDMSATVEESKSLKEVAHLNPLPLSENNVLEANEIALKVTQLNEKSLVSVSGAQNIDTHSSTGDCVMTVPVEKNYDKKICNVTELCNIEINKSENIEGDQEGHYDRNISALDTEDQDYSLNDMTATVEEREDAKKSVDSIILSDIEINIPEKNIIEQRTPEANNTHAKAGEYDMTTTVKDKPLIDELPAHNEHINVQGSETGLIGIQYHNDSETFCKEKHEGTCIFEVNNIYDNCQVINNSITYKDTETKNEVKTEESVIRLLASEATDIKNMSNTSDKTGQSDYEHLPAIDPEFHAFAAIETGSEIDIKPNQDDFVYNTVITSPELNDNNENQSEENLSTSVKVSISSEQVTSDSSNIAASNITTDAQLDEIPIDDLSNEGYEVEVVDSHGEDNIDIVGSLYVRSPEAAPVNESQLKSPVFIDSKEILFNYHDYSKQPKQKENTINLSQECFIDEINSERLDPEASSEVGVKITESSLEVTLKDDPVPKNTSINHSQECIIYQQNSECLDTEGCERADVKTAESSIKVAPKNDSAPENTSIDHGQEYVTNQHNSGRLDTEGSGRVVVKTAESSFEVAPKDDPVPDSTSVNHSDECVINQSKSESLNTEGFAAADVTTAESSLEVAPKDDPVPDNLSINHSQECVTNLLNSERLDREESAEAGVETAKPSLKVAAKDDSVSENTTINLSHECVTNLLNSERLDKESSSEARVNTTSSLEVVLKDDPAPENTLVNQNEEKNIKEFRHVKPKPECKYELYQEDDWLTVITTENEKEETEASPVFLSPNDVFEDTVVVASVSSKNAIIKGYEYDDVYVFPLSESGSNTSNDSIGQELNEDISVVSAIGKDNLHDINFGVIEPVHTYNRKCLKRKISMRDVKVPEKKYRKCKNIDCVKQTVTSMIEYAYSREYKRLLEYCSSIKFSYSRPFHKECLDVEDLISRWPIRGACADVPNDVAEEHLFVDLEQEDRFQPDPATQSLAEEISYEYEKTDAALETPSSEADGSNFNMGFGEGSGRVIQNLKTGGESNISAATLSDVKQSQPVFKSVDLDDYNNLDSTIDDLVIKIRKHFNFIQLRDRVRSFFMKSSVELKSDWIQQNIKDNADLKWRFNDKYNAEVFPFDLCSSEYMKPIPTEAVVQVVQVGQLPVSAAAQNPVTCDPRVTQVSDASPSQCSVDNSPNDDSQSDIKTEYTELTTADLSLPLQEYAQQNHAMNLASHENNIELTEQTISLEMEIKAEESPEIKEEPDIKEEKSNSSDTELRTLNNVTPENIDYSFKNNENKSDENSVIYETPEQNDTETFSQQRQQNGTSEKTDQIAHAMNAAGITTTPETVTNTRAHALVNILSQKIRHGSVNTTQSTTNTYSKTTSINAMALQQALAQILPPPLNQTGSSENNQTQSTTVGPQVLHIVQGKNASGNQITLVDNSQQSVISAPNATQVLHIVQNKGAAAGQTSNGTLTPQNNSFSGLSLVDAGLQQGGNQLLHIVNTGNQKTGSPGQLLKRVNLLTNLANVQGSNEQKMVQFVCKSADGKAIQLNAPHQRSMVLRLQPIETPAAKSTESQEPSPSPTGSASNKESASAQEIKSRSIYEENYAKFIQNSSSKTPGLEKSTSLPKFNQAFGKPVFQEGSQKQGETANNNSHLPAGSTNTENAEGQATDNTINLEHIVPIGSPPLLIRKPTPTTSQSQSNIVQQIKQTIAPMNIQTMHGGVIYTRQIPVNIGGGQTINLITVPSTELINDETAKTQTSQGDIEPSIIKIVPQGQSTTNSETSQEDSSNNHAGGSSESTPTPQPQPVLTQMRIKLPMLSKAPQMVQGARVVRPSFFQIQRNVIGGANQPVYQQLVLTAAPPLGQQTIRLPQAQASRPIKVPSESQASSSESQMSSSTLEQLREFDMVLEQVKERSTVQPAGNSNNNSFKIHTSSSDTTDGNGSSNCSTESAPQVLYTIGNNQSLNVAYVNRKTTPSTYVRSPDSSGIADSPTSSTHVNIPHTVTTDSSPTEMSSTSKPAKVGSKSKSRPKSTSNPPNTLKLNSSVPPKTSSQKPLEDEQTTQRILYILAEYKEQVENSPDKDKPAPRRRSNPPSNPGSSKRKKSSSSRRSGTRDMSPVHGEDTCRTMGSEDSSCGTSQGDCNESCLDSHSPQDSPRKVARKITFDQELNVTQPRPQPQRNVIVADGQTITVARGTTGKPATAVLMPANYILPVSMVKGGQQIAIVTNRGPKLLTVGGEGGATNALLLQRLIGPAGLKPVLARPGVRHVRLPTAALHNLQAFNLATATTVQPPDSTASPTSGPTPPELVDTRATSSPWTDRDSHDVKPERGSSPEGSEPWNLPSSADPHEYSYEETVRTDNMDRTVLDPIPDRYSPDMEAQRIFDKMFDVDSKKSYAVDSPRYDIDPSECDDKAYQVVQKKDGSHRQHRLSHVSAAALRHKYAILEHELRLQKSLSEECEDLGVDSPSASELFPEAELLFAASPAHEHNQDPHHSHTPQPIQSSIPQPDMDDQIATDHLIPREIDVSQCLGDVGIVAVSEDGMQATIALDQEEFARSHPNTTFHSEPTEGEVQPFTITGLKGRHITSTIFHSNSAPATVLMAAPQATVISQAPDHSVKYEIENMISQMPSTHNNDINLSSVLVKDDGLTRFDSILTDSRELHLTNTASAIVHSSGNATQVIRRVCYEDDKRERDARFLIDEPDNVIAGDDAKMVAEDSSRDATLESMADVDDDRSSPERHAELFWESNSASERSESRRPLDFSSDSDKCCKSPSFDETNSTDSSGVGTHMRLDSVIKEARGRERSGSADGSSADDTHPPLRTYPPKRMYHPLEGEAERSLSGKTRAGERSPDSLEVRRRASGRGVVKRGCHCCNGSPAPPRPKKPRQRKPTLDFNTNN